MFTEAFIKEEAARIRDFDSWPNWPVLPVKRKPIGESNLGILVCEEKLVKQNLVTIYKVNMWGLVSGNLFEQLKNVDTEQYSSIEDMVRAGWEGD